MAHAIHDELSMRQRCEEDGNVTLWDLTAKKWYRCAPIDARVAIQGVQTPEGRAKPTAVWNGPDGCPPKPTARSLGPAPPGFWGKQSPLAPKRDVEKTGEIGSAAAEPTDDGPTPVPVDAQTSGSVEEFQEEDADPPVGEQERA